jgi:hypothetical protein
VCVIARPLSLRGLINCADEALYKANAGGSNSVEAVRDVTAASPWLTHTGDDSSAFRSASNACSVIGLTMQPSKPDRQLLPLRSA